MRFCNRAQPSYTKPFACRLNGKNGKLGDNSIEDNV